MANSKQIVYLSQTQYAELIANGSITVDGVTVTYDENDIYVTPQAEPVTDVQVNDTSVVQDGVANIPVANGYNKLGLVKINSIASSLETNSDGSISVKVARVKNDVIGTSSIFLLPAGSKPTVVFYGLAQAAGDTSLVYSTPVGQYTESAKSAISEMLNGSVSVSGTTPTINAMPGVRYVCGEVSTIDIVTPATGTVDVVFTSGTTPAVLTVTPPTGMTMKWANGFDPTSLEANTVYEINIMDGCYGVVGTWT